MYIEFSQLGPRDLISSAKKMIRGPMSEDRWSKASAQWPPSHLPQWFTLLCDMIFDREEFWPICKVRMIINGK
jgi:hypothetical protein